MFIVSPLSNKGT